MPTKTLIYFTMLIFTTLTACEPPRPTGPTISGELKKWHKVTLSFEGPQTSEWAKDNPFLNYKLEVTFTQGNTSYTVPGYYAADGQAAESSAESGPIWRVHFRPDATGEWAYKASFLHGENIAIDNAQTPGTPTAFDGYTGTFEVAESDKQGRDFRASGRIVNGGNGYFKHHDSGQLFIKNGADSPENFLGFVGFDQTYRYNTQKRKGEANPKKDIHQYAPHVKDWAEGDPVWHGDKGKGIVGAANYLAKQGVNSIYMLSLNIQGDGKDVWPYSNHNERYRFDVSKLAQWAIVFDHMEKLGLMIHLVTQETENECLLDGGYTHVQRKLYYRELTARFGHYLGLSWNLGEENGVAHWTPVGQSDQQRKDMAKYIKQVNPYHPIVFLHTHADNHGQDNYLTPLLGFEDLDGPSMQIGWPNAINRRVNKWVSESEQANHRWIVNLDELGPANKGIMPDQVDPAHDTVRHHALWGALMAGASGVEWYFGYKYAHNDLNCEDFRSRENWWAQSKLATQFLSQYPLENMQADNSLVNIEGAFCYYEPEKRYLVYLPNLKNAAQIKLNPETQYQLKWFNPRNGGPLTDGGQITPSDRGLLALEGPKTTSPEEDWVAVIEAMP